MRIVGSLLCMTFFSLTVQAQPSAMATDTDNKLIIAHRGASGYLPEHTLPAKALAHAQGAHYLEQDVVMTRDDQLVVLHDLTLERVSDVEERFPGRARNDGRYYVIDFTLEELRQLRLSEGQQWVLGQRQPVYPQRFPPGQSVFRVHTLAEEIEFIQGLNATTGRQVGIYPELKAPWFHHQEGKDLAMAVLTVLKRYGYDQSDSGAYLQSFDARELMRVADELMPALQMSLPLVQLVAENRWQEVFEPDDNGNWVVADHEWILTEDGLAKVAAYARGVGPAFHMLVSLEHGEASPEILPWTAHAQSLGMEVHPYTFRADPGRVPVYAHSFEDLVAFFLYEVGVDGVFTDFPDRALSILRSQD